MQQKDEGWREGKEKEGRRRAEGKGKEGIEEEESVRPRGGTGTENYGSHATFFFFLIPVRVISLSELLEGTPVWLIWILCTIFPSSLYPTDSSPTSTVMSKPRQCIYRVPNTAQKTFPVLALNPCNDPMMEGQCLWPHYSDAKTETQRAELTCPKSHI